MRKHFLLPSALLILSLVPDIAVAACPGAYGGKACNGGTGADICQFTTTSISCDLDGTAGAAGGDGYYFSPSNTSFRGFGTDASGEAYCCEYASLVDGCGAGNGPVTATFDGTDLVDTIKLQYSTDDLKCATATVTGDSYPDDIHGSRTDATTYSETLYGGGGDDMMSGYAGDDVFYGGSGADTIWAGTGDDFIYGETGADKVKGDEGNDFIYGGTEDDQLCGGPDEDYIEGGDGDDTSFSGIGTYASQTIIQNGGTDHCGSTTYADVSDCTYQAINSCPW